MSQRWVKITEQTLATYQAGGYIDAFKSAALLEGQANPLPESISRTVAKVRGYIKAGAYAVDIDSEKIPASLVSDALAMIVAFAKTRIAQDLSSSEEKANDNALVVLRDIAARRFDIESPDEPEAAAATTQSSGGTSLVRPGANTPKLSDYAGL